MSDVVQLAKIAREHLAAALGALQSSADVPDELMDIADPIAEAMSVFHRVERSNGAQLEGRTEALKQVRNALDRLQAIEVAHPAVDAVMESVAASLSKAHALSRYQPPAPPPAPAPAAPAPQPVAASAKALQPIAAAPVMVPVEPAPIVAPTPSSTPFAVPSPASAPLGAYQPTPAAPQGYSAPAPHAAHGAPAPHAAHGAPAPHAAHGAPAPQGYAVPAPLGYADAAPQGYEAPAPQTYAAPVPQPSPSSPSYASAPAYTPAVQAYTPPVAYAPPPEPAPNQEPYHSVSAPVAYQPPPSATEPYRPPAPSVPEVASQGVRPLSGTGPVIVVELGTQSASNFYKGLAGNDVVEHGGVFIATYKIPKIGSTVTLHLLLPGNFEFHAKAFVQWVREPRSDGTEPGFGARFVEISQDGRQLIYRYARNREPLFYDDL